MHSTKLLDTYYTSLEADKWRSWRANMELSWHNVDNFTTALLYIYICVCVVSSVTMARIVAMLLNIY